MLSCKRAAAAHCRSRNRFPKNETLLLPIPSSPISVVTFFLEGEGLYWVSTRLYKKKMKRRKAKKENQKLFGGVCFIRPVHSARNVCTRFPSFCQIEGDSPPIEGREFVLYQGLSPITCLLFFLSSSSSFSLRFLSIWIMDPSAEQLFHGRRPKGAIYTVV